jgi:hypothetical protein
VRLFVLIEYVNRVPVCLFLNLIHSVRSVAGKVGAAQRAPYLKGLQSEYLNKI